MQRLRSGASALRQLNLLASWQGPTGSGKYRTVREFGKEVRLFYFTIIDRYEVQDSMFQTAAALTSSSDGKPRKCLAH